MAINNLKPALELWDDGFNVIPVKSKPITPTPENPSEDKGLFKQPLISWKKYQDTRVSREITSGFWLMNQGEEEGIWLKGITSVIQKILIFSRGLRLPGGTSG